MSKEAEILRKCVFCHDEHMCQKSRKSKGSCISAVSVLQKVTLNGIENMNIFSARSEFFFGGGGGKPCPLGVA